MLKFIMLLIGILFLAPLILVALIVALPVLPFLLIGGIIWLALKSRRLRVDRPGRSLPTDLRPVYRMDQSSAFAPIALAALAVVMAAQVRLAGFSWQLELGLGMAMVVVGGLWWAQHRLSVFRHTSRTRHGTVASHDLYQLFEIERANGPEERRVLIARELNRLTREALRPDPTLPNTWPSVADLTSLRAQVRLLRSSARDTSSSAGTELSDPREPSALTLASGIQLLDDYVNVLVRVRLLGQGDLEQMRVLVRDQSRLRAMQDEFVGQLQESAPIQVAG